MLFEINRDNNFQLKLNNFNINENDLFQTKNLAWFSLVKKEIDMIYNKYELNEGDIIKLGNLYLKIKKLDMNKEEKCEINYILEKHKINKSINDETNDISHRKENIINMKEKIKENSKKILKLNTEDKSQYLNILMNNINNMDKNESNICRICYIGDIDENNPLISPCSCLGSMRFIHLKCLKYWINSKSFILEEKSHFYIKYRYIEPKCELCKSSYPKFINLNGKSIELFELKSDFNKYVILEEIKGGNQNNIIIYILSLNIENTLLKVGRDKNNILVISNPAISRIHCGLISSKNKLYIHDLDSKYGTLILSHKSEFMLVENINLYLQIGNNFLKFRLINSANNSLFSCCDNCDIEDNQQKNFDYYYRQNLNIEKIDDKTNDKDEKINSIYVRNKRNRIYRNSYLNTNYENDKKSIKINITLGSEDYN